MDLTKKTQKQLTLAKVASQNPEHRFTNLYSLMHWDYWIRFAADAVLSRPGSSTAGVDGKTRDYFKSHYDQQIKTIVGSLKDRSYIPQPVKRVEIPKANGKTRLLGIPTLRDRIVQEALRMILDPIYESDFQPCSYGFRKGRCTMDAIAVIMPLFNTSAKRYYVIEGDLKSYFDTVNHRKLLSILKRRIADKGIMTLIGKFLKAGIMKGKLFERTSSEVPQGGIITPHTHPQTLSLVGGSRLKEGSFNFGFITKSIIFMINGKITESRIGKTHQSYVCFAEKRQASISGNIALDGKIWCIPDTGLSLCSASQGDQWENGYTGNFCSVYGKNTTRPDQPGKKVCKFQRNDYQQSSQGSIGGIFVKERSWPNKRGKLKYPSVMTVCGSKSSLRFTIYLCQPIAKLFQLNNLAMN